MKKTLFAIAVASVFAACQSNKSTQPTADTTRSLSYTDSINNQNLLNDKANEVQLNGLSDTLVTKDGSQYVKVNPNAAAVVAPEATERKSTTTKRTRTKTRSGNSSSSGTSTASTGSSSSSGAGPVYTETAPVPAKKKGWSKAAKGAAIGAGTGAVAGAIISKKKGVGAVVGGLIGAGGGYIIGRKADKKDGRVQ